MNKKIYKKVGLLSISALAALSLAVPVKAEQSCTEYTNYYFFSEINPKSHFNDKTEETIKTSAKYNALPANAVNIKKGKICLENDKTNCEGDFKSETWSLKDFYTAVQERLKDNSCAEAGGCKQTDKENVTYFGLGHSYDSDGNEITTGQNYAAHEQKYLIAGTIQPPTKIEYTEADDLYEFIITRDHTINGATIDGNENSFKHVWEIGQDGVDTVLAPALYKITYQLCEGKFKAEIDYINKDTNKEVHDPYTKEDLSNGDKDSVDSPKVDGCTLVDNDDSTVDYTIDNADYKKIVYYTCKTETPVVNPKTGNALIFVAWVVGLGSLGYSVYWFKKNKKEEV